MAGDIADDSQMIADYTRTDVCEMCFNLNILVNRRRVLLNKRGPLNKRESLYQTRPACYNIYIYIYTCIYTYRETVRNEQTREELGAEETVVQKIKGRRLQWFGHVERMEEKRLPNAALHGHVEGKRSRGRQRKTWMDNVREDLKEKNIDLTRIGEATRNREVWRNLVRASSSAR